MNNKSKILLIIALALIVVALLVPKSAAKPDLNTIFDLKDKMPGTEVYYSPKLGVGFTYMPVVPGTTFAIAVTEAGDTIYVHGAKEALSQAQFVKVFNKAPADSFQTALEKEFDLTKYPKCRVVVDQGLYTPPAGYQLAELLYPPPANADGPFWENDTDCPAGYGRTNSVTYFLYNPATPDHFVFESVGQSVLTGDGTPANPAKNFYGYNWNSSIRILK